MLDVDQNYGTPETPKPFPTFKDCVAQDVQNVIFNPNEFAEERYIDDQGMYKADLLLFVKQKDYGPMPKSGKQITLDKKRIYNIKSCSLKAGMYRMELERVR